jgi:hypothetical protein
MRLGLKVIPKMGAPLQVARQMDLCIVAGIIFRVMTGLIHGMNANPPVGGMHSQTIIVGRGTPISYAMHASGRTTPPPTVICLQWHSFLRNMSRCQWHPLFATGLKRHGSNGGKKPWETPAVFPARY